MRPIFTMGGVDIASLSETRARLLFGHVVYDFWLSVKDRPRPTTGRQA